MSEQQQQRLLLPLHPRFKVLCLVYLSLVQLQDLSLCRWLLPCSLTTACVSTTRGQSGLSGRQMSLRYLAIPTDHMCMSVSSAVDALPSNEARALLRAAMALNAGWVASPRASNTMLSDVVS